jgi:glycosyltransferase involved in cell wall biosynthesis
VRLAVWTPLPPSASGIADYAAEQLRVLARHVDLVAVVEDPSAVDAARIPGVRLASVQDAPKADLDLYQLGNSPAHAYVYRAALARPGVALLHDWSLHHLVLRETVERGDVGAYLREMRRAHGETGLFVGRQVARALGGDLLPALYPLNDRVLEGSLAIVGLTELVATRAGRRLPGRPVLRLPHHLALPGAVPSREQARRALGLAQDAVILTAPGLATASKRLDVAIRALARLAPEHQALRLVVAGELDPRLPLRAWADAAGLRDRVLVTGRLTLSDFVGHLAAADLVLALRFPSHGEISGALVRALGVGRPALVTAGTPAAEEFPEGIVVPVDPGAHEEAELVALVDHLVRRPELLATIGRLAREHVVEHHRLEATVERLVGFLDEVLGHKPQLIRALAADRAPEGTLVGYLMEEVRGAARELGLHGVQLGLEPLLGELTGAPE